MLPRWELEQEAELVMQPYLSRSQNTEESEIMLRRRGSAVNFWDNKWAKPAPISIIASLWCSQAQKWRYPHQQCDVLVYIMSCKNTCQVICRLSQLHVRSQQTDLTATIVENHHCAVSLKSSWLNNHVFLGKIRRQFVFFSCSNRSNTKLCVGFLRNTPLPTAPFTS